MTAGYYRQPSLRGGEVVFVCEDDLWAAPLAGGAARRLTAARGAVERPAVSPDGRWIAFSSGDTGASEVYVMPAEGGAPRRLTFLGDSTTVLGWRGDDVLFTTAWRQPFFRCRVPHLVDVGGGPPRPLPWGEAEGVAVSGDRVAVCRFQEDPARWKRYRGGRAGVIWSMVDGAFRRLALPGNVAAPMWVGERLFFVSDEGGVGNLWSCRPDGGDPRQETHHEDFYARFPSTDGRRVVYGCGADLWLWDGASRRLDVVAAGSRAALQPRFVDASRFLEGVDLHPEGHSVALTVRGRAVTLGAFEGPATTIHAPPGVRHRLARACREGVLLVSDAGGEEALEVHQGAVRRLEVDVGRVVELAVDPTGTFAALTTHRQELVVVGLDGVERFRQACPAGRMRGLSWSPCGTWLAFARPEHAQEEGASIQVLDTETWRLHAVTEGRYRDLAPCWDPDGGWLAFLSHREFDPVYDQVYFDLNFPRSMRPYLVTLRREQPSPFLPAPHPLKKPKPPPKREGRIEIDVDGIAARIQRFPVPEGVYERLVAVRGRLLITQGPILGGLARPPWSGTSAPPARSELKCFDFDTRELTSWYRNISDFAVDEPGETLLLRTGNALRVVACAPPPKTPPTNKKPGRKSGHVDLGRVAVRIDPRAEWGQMLRETWRLMRDQFWRAHMAGVDWRAALARYEPLLDRVATRGEYADLVWELQGELGTSHAYEVGGDYETPRRQRPGRLGADLAWDGAWRVARIVHGEPGDPDRSSPIAAPGVDVREGDAILALAGAPLSETFPPEAALLEHAGREVRVLTERGEFVVKTLADERDLRYRDWVLRNRAFVHEASGGRVGYVHVPDMGPSGYAEFHRDYLVESGYDGLVVDVRYNRGGHVSQLLLEKLARKPIAFKVSRWGQPMSYPAHAVDGPMVALANEFSGSDGDIFAHGFKLLGLGPLVGKRTWGGVIGIWPRHKLVDGSVVTQPEFSSWFADVGWGVENRGTDPEIEVELTPEDQAAGRDPQLARAVEIVVSRLGERRVIG